MALDYLTGKILAGCRITEVIGKGGMGVVYRAHHIELDQERAIKIMESRLADDQAFMKRFRTEAKALARLRSPHIVTVYDLCETDIGLCLVMEYVKGTTLSEMIKSSGPLEPKRLFHIFKQILVAFEHAHGVGVIHRDIKPGNIMVTEANEVKVADFGLAKIQQSAAAATMTQLSGGTLYYSSPEQIEGHKPVDARSDLYSVGMTMYEALTGAVPFDATTSEFKVSEKIVKGDIPPPKSLRPAILKSLNDFVVKAITRNPDRRFQSAAEMRAELEGIEKEYEQSLIAAPPQPAKFNVPLVVAAVVVLAVLALLISRLGGDKETSTLKESAQLPLSKKEMSAPPPQSPPKKSEVSSPRQGPGTVPAAVEATKPLADKVVSAPEPPAIPRVLKLSVSIRDKSGNPIPHFKLRIVGLGGKEYHVQTGADGKGVLTYDIDAAGSNPTADLSIVHPDGKVVTSPSVRLPIKPSRSRLDIDINTFLPDWDKNIDQLMARARALIVNEDWEDARNALKEVLEKRPGQGSAEAWVLLGESWFEHKKKYYPQALEAIDHALMLRRTIAGPGNEKILEKMYYYLVVAGYEQYDDLKRDEPKRAELKQRILDYCKQHDEFLRNGTYKLLNVVEYDAHSKKVDKIRAELLE